MFRKCSTIVAAILWLCSTANSEKIYNFTEPINQTVFVTCAARGAGESVTLVGPLHVVVTLTSSGPDRGSFTTLVHPQQVTGIGTTTGTLYRALGMTRWSGHQGSAAEYPSTFTFIDNFRIVGPGTGNDLYSRARYRLTINANGEVSVEFDKIVVESCR